MLQKLLAVVEFPIIYKYLVKELFKLGNYAPKNVFFLPPNSWLGNRHSSGLMLKKFIATKIIQELTTIVSG